MSQDPNRYNTKIQITAESETISEYGQEYKWTKSPEDNHGVHTLPRPSRKGNLADVVKHKPATTATCAKKKRGRSGVSMKAILCEARNRLPTPFGWWSLAAASMH